MPRVEHVLSTNAPPPPHMLWSHSLPLFWWQNAHDQRWLCFESFLSMTALMWMGVRCAPLIWDAPFSIARLSFIHFPGLLKPWRWSKWWLVRCKNLLPGVTLLLMLLRWEMLAVAWPLASLLQLEVSFLSWKPQSSGKRWSPGRARQIPSEINHNGNFNSNDSFWLQGQAVLVNPTGPTFGIFWWWFVFESMFLHEYSYLGGNFSGRTEICCCLASSWAFCLETVLNDIDSMSFQGSTWCKWKWACYLKKKPCQIVLIHWQILQLNQVFVPFWPYQISGFQGRFCSVWILWSWPVCSRKVVNVNQSFCWMRIVSCLFAFFWSDKLGYICSFSHAVFCLHLMCALISRH